MTASSRRPHQGQVSLVEGPHRRNQSQPLARGADAAGFSPHFVDSCADFQAYFAEPLTPPEPI
jgi:hypothetical protein